MLSQKTNLILLVALLLNLSANLTGMEITYTPDSLIANPVQYLTNMNTALDAFKQEADNLETTKTTDQHDLANLTKKYKAVIQKHEQTCPLFLLKECTKEIGNIQLNNNCLLSRTYKPHFREIFEKHTSQLLIEKLQASSTTPITYTSFGCGEAFQDLIIITKVLIKQPKALLTIHLIDGNNTPYVAAVDFLACSREITIKHDFSFDSRLEEYEPYARNKDKDYPEIQAMSHQALKQQLTLLCLEKEAQYKQFLSWLTQKFPLSQISLYLHDQVINYCNFIKKNNLPHADVITAADIEDDESLANGSIQDYKILCGETLTKNPTSVNAWLGKLDDNSARILTVSLPTRLSFKLNEIILEA